MVIKSLDLSGTVPPRVFCLVAGKAGIGKTTLVSNFPVGDVLYVSAEKGELSIQGSGHHAVSIETLQDLFDLVDVIKQNNVKAVVFDTLTEMYEQIKKDARGRFKVSQNFQKFEDINYWFVEAIKAYRNLSCDTVFLCHTKEEKNGLVMEYELCFDGKLPAMVRKEFDLCIHYDFVKNESGEDVRGFITNPSLSKIAKARVSPHLGITIEDIEEPNIYNLINKLKGEK